MRGSLVCVLALTLGLAAACKTPRTPHRVPLNDVSGVWTAQSTQPTPAGWSLRLDQQDAGKLRGNGSLNRAGATSTFTVNGVRGPYEITMEFRFGGASARFDGSVMAADMIVGRLAMDGDTILLTFERE